MKALMPGDKALIYIFGYMCALMAIELNSKSERKSKTVYYKMGKRLFRIKYR